MKQRFFNYIILLSGILLMAVACSSPLGDAPAGGGVYRSTNFGVDFEKLTKAVLPATTDGKAQKEVVTPLSNSSVTFLKFASGNSKKIFAGTTTEGLFFSEDGGDRWKNILKDFIPHTVIIDPANGDHIYVAGKARSRARLLESTDMGKSWKEVFQDSKEGNSVRGAVVNPSNPKVIVLALLSGHIMRTIDGGATWNVVTNMQDALKRLEWYPGAPLYLLGEKKGLYVSKDSGLSFSQLSEVLHDHKSWQAYFGGEISSEVDERPINIPTRTVTKYFSFAFSETDVNQIFLATDQGLFSSFNQGKDWDYINLPVREAGGIDVTAVSLSRQGGQVYAGIGNVLYFSQNSGQSWQVGAIASTAIINYILVDPEVSQLLYTGMVSTLY